jgi:pimeloyl-ACP methyl ester carboxylesterase
MRFSIIKAFIPWLIFFGFAQGDVMSLKYAVIGGAILLLLFNRRYLVKCCFFEWASLLVFIGFLVFGVYLQHDFIVKYSVVLGYASVTMICFLTLLFKETFTLQHSKSLVAETYWQNKVFIKVNRWMTFFSGLTFLFLFMMACVYYFAHVGSMNLMLHQLPAYSFVLLFAFIIFFPDFYKRYFSIAGNISGLEGISDIKKAQLSEKISIAYRTIGKGPLIVLCHGSLVNMHMWDPDLIYQLSQNFEVMVFDYPGVCQSELNDDSYEFSATNLANTMYQMIRQLKLNPIAIVGYSMGGFVAQALVENHPDAIKNLILIGTDFGGKNRIACDGWVEKEMGAVAFSDDSLDKGLRMMRLLFPKNAVAKMQIKMAKIFWGAKKEGSLSRGILEKEKQLIFSWMTEDQHEEKLKRIELPVLIFAGREDVLVPFGNAILLKNTYKNSELEEYANAGHGLLYQYPVDVAEKIRIFILKNID